MPDSTGFVLLLDDGKKTGFLNGMLFSRNEGRGIVEYMGECSVTGEMCEYLVPGRHGGYIFFYGLVNFFGSSVWNCSLQARRILGWPLDFYKIY